MKRPLPINLSRRREYYTWKIMEEPLKRGSCWKERRTPVTSWRHTRSQSETLQEAKHQRNYYINVSDGEHISEPCAYRILVVGRVIWLAGCWLAGCSLVQQFGWLTSSVAEGCIMAGVWYRMHIAAIGECRRHTQAHREHEETTHSMWRDNTKGWTEERGYWSHTRWKSRKEGSWYSREVRIG